ncbi:unnamed protein product [Rhizoctonia solani]|uniref:H/ACA ribonucleoprotein complex non-core subunit NAF1 n=1 Tax=Rhizoctonia solani TaxID=456999 RepID=A0A8H3H5H2_9AGAM|nr:unnamed protein product [Rhizoctonia solani]
MNEPTPIQDDLLLIMQSYVDVPPLPVKTERQQPLAKPVAVVVEHEDSDEDEVELALQIESSDDEGAGNLRNNAKLSSVIDTSMDNSDSDSDSSDSSSGVELRVTKYPTRKQPVFQAPNDPDMEDDEDTPSGSIAQYAGTKNEILLPEVKAPELAAVPPEDVLELIGEVMTIIDSVVVVKGYTSGVDRVLDTDSLLVFEDRNVFGVVFETFGAVKQPLYSVRFPSASAIDKDTVRVGRQVFHVPTRSNFVFTNEIARIKGSDASNLHDEEVGEDQLEFSDDEAEAQWRRNRSAISLPPRKKQSEDTFWTMARQSILFAKPLQTNQSPNSPLYYHTRRRMMVTFPIQHFHTTMYQILDPHQQLTILILSTKAKHQRSLLGNLLKQAPTANQVDPVGEGETEGAEEVALINTEMSGMVTTEVDLDGAGVEGEGEEEIAAKAVAVVISLANTQQIILTHRL